MSELPSTIHRRLCEIQITLGPEDSSDSYVFIGEATIFYVREGAIRFDVNALDEEELGEPWDKDAGVVQVVPRPGDEFLDVSELDEIVSDQVWQAGSETDSFTISAGGSIYLFNQDNDVALNYTYVDDPSDQVDQSVLLISSAPPIGLSEGTPEATPGG